MCLIVVKWCLFGTNSNIVGLDADGRVSGVDDLRNRTTLAHLCLVIEARSDGGADDILAEMISQTNVALSRT